MTPSFLLRAAAVLLLVLAFRSVDARAADSACSGPEQCDDHNPCTADICVAEACVHDPVPNIGAACSPATACKLGGTCDAEGTCDAANVDDGTSCADASFCDGTETCQAGICSGGPAPCDDNVGCTLDACTEATDSCTNSPMDGFCNDGLYCNGTETCDAVADCRSGIVVDCNDNVGCTADACNETADVCVNTADDLACDDALFCNGVETCDRLLDCRPGIAPCKDAVSCTSDTCNEVLDVCSNIPDSAACDNGSFCDGFETCDPVFDCVTHRGPCDDGIACTVDGCEEDVDQCTNAPNDAACDDGMFCSGYETCDAVAGCLAGGFPCTDSALCTSSSCNEVTDQCEYTTDDTLCDNGVFCDGAETCGSAGCEIGIPPNCSDPFECTADSCNENTDQCDHAANDAACDDGAFCNGPETCDTQSGCIQEAPVDCTDGVECTDDFCNEATDTCDHSANDSLCDDGEFCNGKEICDAVDDCRPGVDPCRDSAYCTEDSCVEDDDLCVNVPDDSACYDGDPCTADFCSPLLDCQNKPIPELDADRDGACDIADNCPLLANPDQNNADCPDPDFLASGACGDRYFDANTDPRRGCCDGGDLCDPCPARTVDASGKQTCDVARSGAVNCPAGTGCSLITADGCISVTVPPGALTEDRSISVTDHVDQEQDLLARDAFLYRAGLRPEGLRFLAPVSVTSCWEDRDDDQYVDEGICQDLTGPDAGQSCDANTDCDGGLCSRESTTRERNLVVKGDGEPLGGDGAFEPPYECGAHDVLHADANGCGQVEPDCSESAGDDRHSVAGCCNMVENSWVSRTCRFGERVVGEFAGDLTPGGGTRQTDCVAEWSVVNPHNEPMRDSAGLPSLDQSCRDGDSLCDHDGAADGNCTFQVSVCFNVRDRRLTDANANSLCAPGDLTDWVATSDGEVEQLADLADAVAALGDGTVTGTAVHFNPALGTRQACTRSISLRAPLQQQTAAAATTTLRMASALATATDEAVVGSTTTTLPEQEPLCGDTDDDRQVDASDALAALRSAVGSYSCDPVLCDVNADGRTLAGDALAILRTGVGQSLELACGRGPLPSDRDRLRLTCMPPLL